MFYEFSDSNELLNAGLKPNMHFSNYQQWWKRFGIDKKTAWATLKPPRKDLQIETLGDRSVENFVGAENKRNTTSVARFSSNPIACRYIHDPSLKVDRISLNSNVYRNGVFADEYLCFFSRNLTRERERESQSIRGCNSRRSTCRLPVPIPIPPS